MQYSTQINFFSVFSRSKKKNFFVYGVKASGYYTWGHKTYCLDTSILPSLRISRTTVIILSIHILFCSPTLYFFTNNCWIIHCSLGIRLSLTQKVIFSLIREIIFTSVRNLQDTQFIRNSGSCKLVRVACCLHVIGEKNRQHRLAVIR